MKIKPTPSQPFTRSTLSKAITTCLFGMGLSHTVSHAATIVVTSNQDNGANCTLREAVQSINTREPQGGCSNSVPAEDFGDNDTILFDSSLSGQTIQLDEFLGQITINSGQSLSVDASALADRVTIDAQKNSRIFYSAATSLTLNNLRLINGTANYAGAIISSSDSLRIVNSELRDNTAATSTGGAINGSSAITIENSSFINNLSGSAGGAISVNGGSLRLENSLLSDNEVTAGDGGGAIYAVNSSIDVVDSRFVGNSSGVSGGAMRLRGNLGDNSSISGTSFINNSAYTGGAIDLLSTQEETLRLIIQASSFSGNQATTLSGGAIYSYAFDGAPLNDGYFVDVDIVNTTFSGNSAARGGAISSQGDSQFTFFNSTIVNNTASQNLSGGLYAENLGNFIIGVNNVIASNSGGDCNRIFLNGGSNWIEDDSCIGTAFGDPMLGDLANNGGSTLSHAPLPGSPLIDTGNPFSCSAEPVFGVDQRNEPRGTETCFIGAVEVIEDTSGFFVIPLPGDRAVVVPN